MLFVGLDHLLRNRSIYDCISSVHLEAVQPIMKASNCFKISVSALLELVAMRRDEN